jgi:hypothetical protein
MGANSPIEPRILAETVLIAPIIPIAIAVAVLVVILINLAVAAQRRAEERRRQEFLEIARRLGFECFPFGFAEDQPAGFWASLFSNGRSPAADAFLGQFEGFEPFGVGHSYLPLPILRGIKDGVRWVLFDYEYKVTTSTGKTTSTVTYNVSVVAARPPFELPPLRLSPEGFWSRLGAMLGMQDIQFESEDFNKRYKVQGQDQRAVYDLLHPQAIEYLLQVPDRTWQMAGAWLMIVERGRVDPTAYLQVVEEADGFLKLVPEYYRQDRASNADWPDPLDAAGAAAGGGSQR